MLLEMDGYLSVVLGKQSEFYRVEYSHIHYWHVIILYCILKNGLMKNYMTISLWISKNFFIMMVFFNFSVAFTFPVIGVTINATGMYVSPTQICVTDINMCRWHTFESCFYNFVKVMAEPHIYSLVIVEIVHCWLLRTTIGPRRIAPQGLNIIGQEDFSWTWWLIYIGGD